MPENITKPIVLDQTVNRLVDAVDKVSIKSDIVDNLTTESATKALSANQGKVLDEKIATNASAISSLSGIHQTAISNSTYLRGDISVYRTGNLVTITLTAGAKDLPLRNYVVIGTLPLGYRPPQEVQTPARSPVSDGNPAFVIVASTGEISFYSYVGSSGAITWAFTLTYVTADPMPN